jgi:8-oxo-dGTP pyrophosphatase MutT (NUDIX family)
MMKKFTWAKDIINQINTQENMMNVSRAIATMLEEFQRYQPYDDLEAQHQRQLIGLIQTAVDPLDADCFVPGHGTGSVWIFDPRTRQVAMIFHNKLKRWLQPGGHAELDEPNLKVTALREAEEELGLQLDFEQASLFDIDVHLIPESLRYPEHWHFDVRYLCLCDVQPLIAESEDSPAQWFDLDYLASLEFDTGLDRMIQKTIGGL